MLSRFEFATRRPFTWIHWARYGVLSCLFLSLVTGGCTFFLDPFCFSHIGENPRTFPDFEARLEQLRTEAAEANCGCLDSGRGIHLTVGQCGDGGVLFISDGSGFGGRTDYYNADGNFIGLSEWKDSPSLPCGFSREWPRRIECADPVVTEVICELGVCEEP